ncbi:hypothetical protein EXH44_09455 [Actinobacillus indolicus]|uniref:Lipoprotein n=1 Tax=Actinobacillus indolicus TaxID=51049 RepID=A0A4V1AY79_9PAST|nr:hypothetical protein [Actinobacillus indolicus]QBQ64430.1 hypothetical protein EXH44_09455 [Actinobacillus indolicus]
MNKWGILWMGIASLVLTGCTAEQRSSLANEGRSSSEIGTQLVGALIGKINSSIKPNDYPTAKELRKELTITQELIHTIRQTLREGREAERGYNNVGVRESHEKQAEYLYGQITRFENELHNIKSAHLDNFAQESCGYLCVAVHSSPASRMDFKQRMIRSTMANLEHAKREYQVFVNEKLQGSDSKAIRSQVAHSLNQVNEKLGRLCEIGLNGQTSQIYTYYDEDRNSWEVVELRVDSPINCAKQLLLFEDIEAE